jgi:hypothetical protein
MTSTGAGSPVKDSTKDGETATMTTVDGVTTEMADIDLSERSEGDSI